MFGLVASLGSPRSRMTASACRGLRVGEFRGRGMRCPWLMELRDYNTPEPSHIHVPRPSRTDGAPLQLSMVDPLDQGVLMEDHAGQSCCLSDAD